MDAGTEVALTFGVVLNANRGNVRVEAFGGPVEIGPDFSLVASDGSGEGDPLAGGQITLKASESVILAGAGTATAVGKGGIRLHAHGKDVTATDEVTLTSTGDTIDIHAANDVTLGTSGGGFPRATGVGVSVVAANGAATLDVVVMDATSGLLSVHSQDTATVEGAYRSQVRVDATSVSGSLLMPQAIVFTEANVGGASGDITLESFGGSSATIDATGASVRSGNNAATSGDVELSIHAPLTDSFVLPKNVAIKVNAKKPAKSKMTVAGFFDTGAAAARLAGPATISVAGLTFAGTLAAKGRKFEFKDDSITFSITPHKSGSSRAKFKLQVTGEQVGTIDLNGSISVRFATASADGRGTVELEAGKYRLGKRRGALSEPGVFPFKAKATHKGGGKDKLSLTAGIATDGGTPATAPDVMVRYGDSFEVTIPGGEFTPKGDTFTAKNPPSAPGISQFKVDYGKEQLSLKGKNLDLGALPGGPIGVPIEISLGTDTRAVQVRMAPKGKSLKY